MRHYLEQVHRVLKSGGRLLFGCFLLNRESQRLIAQGQGSEKLMYEIEGGFTSDLELPEKGIGFSESLLLSLVEECGLRVVGKYYGSWCGHQSFTNQDLLVLQKKSELSLEEKTELKQISQTKPDRTQIFESSKLDNYQKVLEQYKSKLEKIQAGIENLSYFSGTRNKYNKTENPLKQVKMTKNPFIEILEVQKLSKESESLIGFNIDSPQKGQKIDDYSIPIVGWVLGKGSPTVVVEFLSGGKVLQKVPVSKSRPGVEKRFPKVSEAKSSGFAAAVGVLGLPPVANLKLRCLLADGTIVPLADIKLHHQPLDSGYQPRLQPLVLNSTGRSGSTWFMRLLSQHPAIVACPIYAYETRVWPFWMQLLQFLSQRANPIETPFQADYPPKAAAFCQETLDAFYEHIAEAQGKIISSSELTYFAEKNTFNPNLDLLMEIYPQAKEIILVRDFRDVTSSILAFNKKRGSDDFGRNKFKSDEEYIKG